ncbi:MAG: HNH endonuclease [Actinomycetota bacterium]|nr:HNH endonuclease [Actinomycetota bacterium]
MRTEGFVGVTGTAELAEADSLLASYSSTFLDSAPLMGKAALLESADLFETLSRKIQYLQIAVAHAIDTQNLHNTGDTDTVFTWDTPSGEKSQYKTVQNFLRDRLRISLFEAGRRVGLGRDLLPRRSLIGEPLEPRYPSLAAAAASGQASTDTLHLAARALDNLRVKTTPENLCVIEESLATPVVAADPDYVNRIARDWSNRIDQDGQEPSEAELAARQGVHFRGIRRGLHHFEIFASQGQAEVLTTVLNTGTNPRLQTEEERTLDPRTRPQKYLDALTGACQAALASNDLPATGGNRPQVLVTIDYDTLLGQLEQVRAAASFAYTGPVSASTIRQMACDAGIIPVVLNGKGQILNYGRKLRLFTRGQRLALTARDKGCAFPGCTIPPAWCEAHHVDFWNRLGETNTDRGALLCSHHHHLIHQERWCIDMTTGAPRFIPPPEVDPSQRPRTNTYFNPPAPAAVALT